MLTGESFSVSRISQSWEGQTLQNQQGSRCQNIRKYRRKNGINTGGKGPSPLNLILGQFRKAILAPHLPERSAEPGSLLHSPTSPSTPSHGVPLPSGVLLKTLPACKPPSQNLFPRVLTQDTASPANHHPSLSLPSQPDFLEEQPLLTLPTAAKTCTPLSLLFSNFRVTHNHVNVFVKPQMEGLQL